MKRWGKDVNVDVEQSLNFCIRQIRAALNDGSKEPRYIETIPRVGYRFIAPILREGDNDASSTLPEPLASAEVAPDALPVSLHQPGLMKWLSVGAAALVIIVSVVAGVRRSTLRRESDPVRISYVTTYPRDELDPSLSPDGSSGLHSPRAAIAAKTGISMSCRSADRIPCA